MSLIELRDVMVNYNLTQALCNVTLDIHEGEFIGICGPNGSGKTTLLKSILGLIKLDSGTIKVNGQHITRQSKIRADIGYVPQLKTVDPHFPGYVKDIVMMGRIPRLGIGKRPSSEDHLIVNEIIDEIGITDIKNKPIGQISGGQLQKTLLARALAQKPKILLLDEPTSALDYRMTKSFMEILKEMNRSKNLTIISVHHDLQLLMDYASRIICLDRTVEWVGPPNDAELDNELLRLFFYQSPH